MKKKVTDLIKDVSLEKTFGGDVWVTSITDDSRKVKKGSLFIAVKGLTVDGHEYIDKAIAKGASVVVGEKKPKKSWLEKATYIKVKGARLAIGKIASNWYGNPSKKLTIIGITGTDGKTTTANILYKMLKADGKEVSLISTINAKIGNSNYDTGLHVTNPDAINLHKLLSVMVKKNCKIAILEVTSHGIDQGRIEGVHFDIGILTNITHEHLDYHKTWKNYADTKLAFLQEAKKAIINKDDKSYSYAKKKLKRKETIDYSIEDTMADCYTQNLVINKNMSFEVFYKDKKFSKKIKTNLAGEYNVSNILAAICAAKHLGVKETSIERSLSKFGKLVGRMEEVRNSKAFLTMVDFAHTPNSLEKVLNTLRKKTKGKLIVIFGCAGERDIEKRKTMPKIAVRIADISIFTAEDPRSESVDNILSVMAKSALQEGAREIKKGKGFDSSNMEKVFMRIPERGEAISFTIQKIAKKGDTVVVCGKGHEKSMAYGKTEYPWSDLKAVRWALKGKTLKIERN